MKKSELVIDKEYYVQPSNDTWRTSAWNVKRVRIVDTEHAKWKWNSKTGKYEKTTYSTGFTGLVAELLDIDTGAVVGRGVVTLASIRGEWEPTRKMVQERRDANTAAAEALKQKQLLAQLKTGQAVALAKQMNVPGVQSDVYGRKVEMDPEVLVAMLSALDAQGWVYAG